MIIGSSFVIVIINIITCMIFEKIVAFEKRHKLNEETIGQFVKITIMQFVNIALVILFVNFDFIGQDNLFLGFLPIFNGSYKDFNVGWYD